MFPPLNAPTESFPYQIDGQVGIGSMGVVYKAVEVSLDRKVAIKALRQSLLDEEPPGVQDELRRRFLQEARAAAALSHPGVTTVYRVGKEAEIPYIVMEWLDGRSLDLILKDKKRLELAESIRLTVSLLETLDVAHRQGVVHRDIKPSNLMLLGDGRLKVTDFGIALLKGRELVKTQAGVVLATPKFASPEQLRGLEVDGRADLFATGILLYRLLTGCFPFEGSEFMELANAILQKEPIPARERLADIPPALEAVLRRALRKSRKDRFGTAAEMADELRPFLAGKTRRSASGPLVSRVQAQPALPAAPRDRSSSPATPIPAGAEETVPTLRAGPSPPEPTETIYRELPPRLEAALGQVIERWPERGLAYQSTTELLDRLLDKPLHAPAFTGAVRVGPAFLLIAEGVLIGAFDTAGGEASGDAVVENLPSADSPVLYTLPGGMPARAVSLLATLLHPASGDRPDLDTSLINLPAWTHKLRDEAFDGILRLRFGEAFGAVLFAGGSSPLSLFSEGWGEVPVERSWRDWLTRFPVCARVEELRHRPLDAWFRRALRNFELQVTPSARGPGVLRPAPTQTAAPSGHEQVSAFRGLRFLVERLPKLLAERQRVSRWKYLAEWIPLIRTAILYCDLPRPGSRESDRFDFVTADERDKILHVGQRVARLSTVELQSFLDKVIAAKKARLKTGDVGGAILIAPEIGEEVLDAYDEALGVRAKSWYGAEESFTGYSGFLRIGARRGFHLLLIEEDGKSFHPII